jgi:hypothetical protein
MKIFNSIQLGYCGPTCQNCKYFQNDPALIEESYPGLSSMSSGFASARDRDGFCNFHQLYLSARHSCAKFNPLSADALQPDNNKKILQ